VEANSVTETRQYVWGGGALLQYADSSGTYYVHENGYGSVMATTSAGVSPAIYDRFDHDAYGRFTRTGTTTAMPFAFRSMLYDAEIGLYSISNGAYYNPALGSYLSRVLVSATFSRYALVATYFLGPDIFFQTPAPPRPCVPKSIDWSSPKGAKSMSSDTSADLNYSTGGKGFAVFGFDTIITLTPLSGPWTGCTYLQFIRGFQLDANGNLHRWGRPTGTVTKGLGATLNQMGAATAIPALTPVEEQRGRGQTPMQGGFSLDGVSTNGSNAFFQTIHQRRNGAVVWLDQAGSYQAGNTKTFAFLDFITVAIGNDPAQTKVQRKMRVFISEALGRGVLQKDHHYFTP